MLKLPKTKDITNYALFVLIKRGRMLAITGIGVFITVLLLGSLATPTWKATTKVLVERNPVGNFDIFSAGNNSTQITSVSGNDVLNMKILLSGESIARQIVSEFKLDDKLRENRLAPESFKKKIRNLLVNIVTSPGRIISGSETNWTDLAVEKLINEQQVIKVESDSNVISIEIRAEKSEIAVNIANRMVELLKERSSNFSKDAAIESYPLIQRELIRAQRKLQDAKENVANYKINNSIVIIEKEKIFKMARIDAMEAELDATARDIEETTSRLAQVTQEMGKLDKKIILSSIIARNPLVIELESTLENLEIEFASALILKTSNHPKMEMLRARINRVHSTLIETVERITKSRTESVNPLYQNLLTKSVYLKIDDIALNAREKAINKGLIALNEDIRSIPDREFELEQYKETLKAERLIYRALSTKLGELSLKKNSFGNDYAISVLDRAYLSANAKMESPYWIPGFPAAIILGVFFGLGLIFVVEFFNDSIKSAVKVNSLINVPCLGVLPDLTKLKGLSEAVLVEDDY